MELSVETLKFLSQCFFNILSPQPETRLSAEAALSEAANRPNYGLDVLRLVAEPAVGYQIRQSAAVSFENYLKDHWAPQPNAPEHIVVSDQEKEQIKALIMTLMVNSSPKIRPQLNVVLTSIGKHEFPKAWQSLLPDLVGNLGRLSRAKDYVSANVVLAAINSLFKKFRSRFKTDELLLDLKYCLDNFAKPLLEVFKRTAVYLDQAVAFGRANAGVLKGYIESQRLCCRIFYSLNFMELPECFEDHMDDWMIEFWKYLTVKYPALEDSGNDGLALVDDLRTAICENISLYMEKEEVLFQKYLSGFVEAIRGLLVAASSSSSRERLTVTAIKFLTTVSTSVHHTLFAGDDVLQQICQSIVIPNVMLRDEDEELFEMKYVEFIRRDMEGSDLDTRRRVACELLKGIALNYKEKVRDKVLAQVQGLLALFAENPAANWKHKDCAIYLVVSLATKKAGSTSVSIDDLVDVESFFESVIVPELQSQVVDGFPMLKAGALKFFTMFRNRLSEPVAMALLPDAVRLIGSESNVVHSYAASCIDKLLLVKDDGGREKYSAADVGPYMPVLVTNLVSALQKLEPEEDQYVMKCIRRVLGVANVSCEVALSCINGLTTVVNRVYESPKNPAFNQYLFESVALLIRQACEQDPSLISAFENSLLPILQMILSRDVTELFPYACQLVAQLVDLNGSPFPRDYSAVFYIVLRRKPWKEAANVPGLVPSLQAFLRKAPEMPNKREVLSSVLEIFMLASSASIDEQGFYVLNMAVENFEYDVILPYISNIWNVLFERLQSNSTEKFTKSLIIFMSLFVVKHGSKKLTGSMNAVQPDIFRTVLEHYWVPNIELIKGSMELKFTSVALTKIICESLSPSDSELWGKVLDSIVTLLALAEEARVEEEQEVLDFNEAVGCNVILANLYNAGRRKKDPLHEIDDPKYYFVASLAAVSCRSPGTCPQIINEYLDPYNQAVLLQLCSSYDLAIV